MSLLTFDCCGYETEPIDDKRFGAAVGLPLDVKISLLTSCISSIRLSLKTRRFTILVYSCVSDIAALVRECMSFVISVIICSVEWYLNSFRLCNTRSNSAKVDPRLVYSCRHYH